MFRFYNLHLKQKDLMPIELVWNDLKFFLTNNCKLKATKAHLLLDLKKSSCLICDFIKIYSAQENNINHQNCLKKFFWEIFEFFEFFVAFRNVTVAIPHDK